MIAMNCVAVLESPTAVVHWSFVIAVLWTRLIVTLMKTILTGSNYVDT